MFCIIFPKFYVMQSLYSKELIGAGDCVKGLYWMGMMTKKKQAMMTSLNTWHKRLGHMSISKHNGVGLVKDVSLKGFRDSCNKAKFARLPSLASKTKTVACFDLIHCDVWGKYRTLSFTRVNYFLTIVDDFSRAI